MRKTALVFKFLNLNLRGFTLIELIVVFTVLSALSVVGLASFVSYSRSQALTGDINNIVAIINKARSNSLSQVKKTTQCPNSAIKGYVVKIAYQKNTANSGYYSLGILCQGETDPSSSNLTAYSLAKNISFITNAQQSSKIKTIFFPVLTGGTIITNVSLGDTISSGDIVISGYGKTKTINVKSTGIITVQ